MRIRKSVKFRKQVFLASVLFMVSLDVVSEEVSKDIWVEAMKSQLPSAFCHSMEFFRQCFEVNDDQCIEAASLATKICLHKYINQIPDTLNQPNDGAKWGNIIGQCAGENYHQTLSRNFKDIKECNNMDHWK